MKYIVCNQPGNFSLLEKDEPQPVNEQALVRMKRVGICGTDMHAFAGRQPFFTYPRILGHELSAEVISLPDGISDLKPGDPVVVMPYDYCGECIACRRDKTNCCTSLNVVGVHSDGGMQEMYTIPAHLLIPAQGLSLEEMAIVEPLAIGRHAVQRAQLEAGETVLVIGCGPIGIGTIKMAQVAGAEVIAMDINEQRLQYCKDVLGVKHTANALENPLESIKSITKGDLATAVFDATGNRKSMEYSYNYMSAGGRYVFIGLHKGDISFHHPSIHARETSILCSRNATTQDMKDVIDILRQGLFPTNEYITHKFHFSEMIDQFEQLIKPETGVIKAMTVWE